MKELKIVKILVTFALLIGVLLFYPCIKTEAAGTNREIYKSGNATVEKDQVNRTIRNSYILESDSSGVPELDNAKGRVNGLVKWVLRWAGWVIAVCSLVYALAMQSSHQIDQRNAALVVAICGVVIAFSPEIVNYILGLSS